MGGAHPDRLSPTVFLARYMRKRNKDLEIHKKFKILDQELQDLTEVMKQRPT
jgi:hypothetical protein